MTMHGNALATVDIPASTYAADELRRAAWFAIRNADYGRVVRLVAVRRHPGGHLTRLDQLCAGASTADMREFATNVWRHREETIVVSMTGGVLYAPEWMRG